jgi:hypothetical protein
MHGAERVIGLVCSIAVGILEGRIGLCPPCTIHGDCVGVVLSSVVLDTDGIFRLVCLAELSVVTITLVVAVLGGWVLGEVFVNIG